MAKIKVTMTLDETQIPEYLDMLKLGMKHYPKDGRRKARAGLVLYCIGRVREGKKIKSRKKKYHADSK